jgi:hypothetical protein
MRWFVVVPGSLVPAPLVADIVGPARTAEIAAWLARATRAADHVQDDAPAGAAHLSWLWRTFGGTAKPVTAPYAWRALSHASALLPDDGSQWWHCDPIHIDVGRDELLVGRSADAQMSEAEADALAAVADAVLREHGALLKRLRHDAWFVQADRPWQLETVPLSSARGRPLGACLPTGTDAAHWRKVLTEIQVRWHQHAVNDAREQRGLQPVNGVWLHGGGRWERLPRAPFATIVSDDAVLRGWALAAGLPPAALRDDDAAPNAQGDAVSLWTDLLEPASFESWGVWIERLRGIEARLGRLRARAFDAGYDRIELMLCGRRIVRVLSLRRHDTLRFWRRASMQAAVARLAEPVEP